MRLFKWVLLGTLVGVIVLVILGMYVLGQLKPTKPGEEVVFTIEPGTSSMQIAIILEEQGMIRNALIFSNYLKFKNLGSRFQAGTYAMSPGLDIQQVIQRLNEGDVVAAATLRFTVPEGFTIRQTIELLSQEGYSKAELESLLLDPTRFSMTRAGDIPEGVIYKERLEGYLFPETYEMPKDAKAEQVIERMIVELDRKLQQLPQDWEKQLVKHGISFHDMLTIASLIEREVVAMHERPIVSGVIYNRLKKKMHLQIDASVQYALDAPKARLFEKDLQIESPYNTYLHPGLPPGPIASPGLESIRAALYPQPTDHLFYVTKKDGTGEHFFAKTYGEHLKNIKRSKSR